MLGETGPQEPAPKGNVLLWASSCLLSSASKQPRDEEPDTSSQHDALHSFRLQTVVQTMLDLDDCIKIMSASELKHSSFRLSVCSGKLKEQLFY